MPLNKKKKFALKFFSLMFTFLYKIICSDFCFDQKGEDRFFFGCNSVKAIRINHYRELEN